MGFQNVLILICNSRHTWKSGTWKVLWNKRMMTTGDTMIKMKKTWRHMMPAWTATHIRTHLVIWTVLKAVGKRGGEWCCLGLQIAEAQRQGKGERKCVGYREWGRQQKEEDEEEAGHEWWWLDGQEMLEALRQEVQLGQVREAQVSIFIQERRQVWEMQGEGEKCSPFSVLVWNLLAFCRACGDCVLRTAPSALPPPHFSGGEWGGKEGVLGGKRRALTMWQWEHSRRVNEANGPMEQCKWLCIKCASESNMHEHECRMKEKVKRERHN